MFKYYLPGVTKYSSGTAAVVEEFVVAALSTQQLKLS